VGWPPSTTVLCGDHVAFDNDRRYDPGAMSLDLRRLRYFVAVADEQHFGRAAARLNMSAPPLSQRIRELEAELGVALFERSSRRVALTDAGQRLLAEAQAVLRAADRFRAVASDLAAAGPSLALAYCHGSEHAAFAAARRFRQRHPEVPVRPNALTSLRIFRDLRAGKVSVGIVHGPVPDTDRFATTPLARVPFDHLSIPEGHRLASLDVVHVTDLDGEAVLLVERSDAPSYHDATLAYCAAAGTEPVWVLHPASQVERVLDMVGVGTGIGWLNAWQADQVRHDGVVVRPLQPVTRFDELHLVWRRDDQSPITHEFTAIAQEVCQ
jgi:DNA-binding transcriptional LysR family regulator